MLYCLSELIVLSKLLSSIVSYICLASCFTCRWYTFVHMVYMFIVSGPTGPELGAGQGSPEAAHPAHIHIYIHRERERGESTCVYIYIYIYIEREIDR